MKRCPFCAEEIQDAAIKCKHCGSFLSTAPTPAPGQSEAPAAATPAPRAATPTPVPAPAPAADPPAALEPAHGPPPMRKAASASADRDERERKVLYEGVPSWRAFLGSYTLGVIGAILVPVMCNWMGRKLDMSGSGRILMVLIPLALAAVYFFGLHLYRRSIRFRVTTTNIETERGILSKKIDVLPLWRCRDIRYKQNLVDRILGIAHVELFTADVTTPHLEIVGLPASRQLFERIRDCIEVERQAKNIYGVIS